MTCFTWELDGDGIARITWDTPDRSMNVIDVEALDELDAIADRLRQDAGVKAAIITSAKKDFSAGADLTLLDAWLAEGGAPALRFSKTFRALETCGKPIVAALNGTALGGGFELALACNHRICAEDETIALGLPEARIGLLPRAGGTQRLPRLIGVEQALRLMLQGCSMHPSEALALGALDAVVPQADLIARAKSWILQHATSVQPWDETPPRRVDGAPYQGMRGMGLWSAAIALYVKETHDNYDAQRAILSAVYEGLLVANMDAALAIEARWFLKILHGPQVRAMTRTLFQSRRQLAKGARRPKVPPREVKTLGIIGAGFMGSAIAAVAAMAGMKVILIDSDLAAASRAANENIRAEADYTTLAACDLVIEAVYEDPAIKTEVLTRAAAHLKPGAVLASNTSSLPITSLAQSLPRKENFLGIHFFSPVAKMQLVELIRSDATDDACLALAMDFVRQLRKVPIVVRDAPGFFTSRVVMRYVGEGHAMLAEGVAPALIENAAKACGMPVGPLALADEVGLDVALAIRHAARKAGAPPEPADDILGTMVTQHHRKGRKAGKGYYDYPEAAPKQLWPHLLPTAATHADFNMLKDRFLFIQALETARVLEQGIVTDLREADVGAVLGFGFAPFTGGPLTFFDQMGPAVFVARCEALAEQCGARFAPTQGLCRMAAQNQHFYA